MICTQVTEEKHPVGKASIDEFYLDITEWIGFKAVTSGQMNSQSIKETGLPAKFYTIR
jgi:hypothetical protein